MSKATAPVLIDKPLNEMTDTERDAWYTAVMVRRMAALTETLDPDVSPEARLRAALSVAGWALVIAGHADDAISGDKWLTHRRGLISAAGSAITMAESNTPGDKVTLTWAPR